MTLVIGFASFGVALLLFYGLNAVLHITRRGNGEGVSGSLNFQIFVARRYLMVPEPKVTRTTRIAVAASAAVAFPCGVAINYGAKLPETVLVLAGLASSVLMIAVVGGVLRYSKPALYLFFGSAVICGAGIFLNNLSVAHQHAVVAPFIDQPGLPTWFGTAVLIMIIIGSVLNGLAILFGTLRAFFTFFTTVPIGGVFIGTAALVCVLSVMSGFETDLREKILGSNAHIQVTPEDGELTGWREIKARIDKVPGVVASTPYAQSEVVIAANNNGMSVIIKGIDPDTVGKVTQLVADIDEPDPLAKAAAMARLNPLAHDAHDLQVKPRAPSGVDPAPPALTSSGDPIDFSQPSDVGSAALAGSNAAGSGAGSAGAGAGSAGAGSAGAGSAGAGSAGAGSAGAGSAGRAGSASRAGSAHEIISNSPFGSDDAMRIPIDANFDSPTMSKRTQLLPGILIGKELEKQTHLYEGEEVRVVSPLSDPSNPDATGTPIPFNRDYRVAGVFFTGMYEYDLKYVYVTLDSMQEFLDRGDAVDGIEVRVTSPDDTEEVMPRIRAALGPKYRVQDWKELNRSLFSALKLEKIAMFIVLGIVILVASFSIVGNLIMVVVEKGREIALLKTLGASDTGVMQLFAIQGLLIGLIGTTLGVAVGLGGCYLGKHFGIPLNPDVYYIDKMPVHVDASSVVVTFLAGVVISIAATFYPALLAARVRPAAGMRH